MLFLRLFHEAQTVLILVALKYATLYAYHAISGIPAENKQEASASLLAMQWLGIYLGTVLVTSLATGLIAQGDADAEDDDDGPRSVPDKYPRAYALLVYSSILLPAYTIAATLLALERVLADEVRTEELIDLGFSGLAVVFAVSMLYHLQLAAAPAWPARFVVVVAFFCTALKMQELYLGVVVVFAVFEALSAAIPLVVPDMLKPLSVVFPLLDLDMVESLTVAFLSSIEVVVGLVLLSSNSSGQDIGDILRIALGISFLPVFFKFIKARNPLYHFGLRWFESRGSYATYAPLREKDP